MAIYGLTLKDDSPTITVKAEWYEVSSSFINFYRLLEDGTAEIFASYSCDSVKHCVKQNKYTEDEIMDQLKSER